MSITQLSKPKSLFDPVIAEKALEIWMRRHFYIRPQGGKYMSPLVARLCLEKGGDWQKELMRNDPFSAIVAAEEWLNVNCPDKPWPIIDALV